MIDITGRLAVSMLFLYSRLNISGETKSLTTYPAVSERIPSAMFVLSHNTLSAKTLITIAINKSYDITTLIIALGSIFFKLTAIYLAK